MTRTYGVSGMSCEGCVRSVTNAVSAAAKGATVTVDLAAGTVTVAETVPEEVVRQAVEDAGFTFEGAR